MHAHLIFEIPFGTKPNADLVCWIEQTEGAKFWLKVVNELKARGVNDIPIAVVDGLIPRGDRSPV